MSDVFISYSRKDEVFVRQLFDELTERGRQAWVDWEDIPATANWWQEIEAGIESADTFVFVISQDSVRSDVCYREIEHAVSLHKRIVPILYRDIQEDEDKRKMHPAISSHNWVFFDGRVEFTASFDALITAMDTDLEHVRYHTRLLVRAKEWDNNHRNSSYLLDGVEIERAQTWLAEAASKDPRPTALHADYVVASRRRQQRRQRNLLISVIAAFIITLGLAIVSFFLFQQSSANLSLAMKRGTEVANQALTSDANAILALNNASTADANATQANENARIAANNEQAALFAVETAEARGTEVAQQAATSAANALLALNNASTADANAILALNNASTADANATQANENARIAANNEQAALFAVETAEARGTEVAQQAATSAANALLALNNASTADANAILAENNAATADANSLLVLNALATSEFSEKLARAQALAVNADNALEVGDTDLAIALALEASRLNDTLIQAQSVLNRAVAVSPVWVASSTRKALFSPDGTSVLTLSLDGNDVSLWDIATRAHLRRFNGHLGPVNDIAFSPDGRFIFTASSDTSVVKWDVTTGQEVYRLTGHRNEPVLALAISPDGKYLATGGFNPPMMLWDVETGELVVRFVQSDFPVSHIRFSGDGRTIFTETTVPDVGVTLWQTSTGAIRYTTSNRYLGWSTDNRQAWALERNGNITLWNPQNESIIRRFNAKGAFLATRPDGQRALLGQEVGRNAYIPALYEVASGGLVGYFDNFSGRTTSLYAGTPISSIPVRSAAFLADNRTVLSVTATGGTIFLWDSETGFIVRIVGRDDRAMTFYALSSDERYALTISEDGRARIWDVRERQDAEITRIDQAIFSVNPDNTVYITTNPSGFSLFAWNAITGERISRIETPNDLFSTSAFSPNGDYYLTGSLFGTLIQWDYRRGREIRRWEGHNDAITQILFSQDGSRVFTASQDGTARIWDANRGQTIGRFVIRGGSRGVLQIALSPDESKLALYNGLTATIFDVASSNTLTTISREPIEGEDRASGREDNLTGSLLVEANTFRRVAISRDGQQLTIVTKTVSTARNAATDEVQDVVNFYVESYDIATGTRTLGQFIPNTTFNLTYDGFAFSPDGQQILIGLDDASLILFDIRAGEQIRRMIGHDSPVESIAFSPVNDTALSTDGSQLILWDVNAGQIIRIFSNAGGTVWFKDAQSAVTSDPQRGVIWRIEDLSDTIAYTLANRYVPQLTCPQREQYNIPPLCNELGVLPTPTLPPNITPSPTPNWTATNTAQPTLTPTAFLRGEIVSDSGTANIRANPNNEATVLISLPNGTILDIIEDRGAWFRVALPDGRTGWIAEAVFRRK